MALSAQALSTVATTKTALGIVSTDTSEDAWIEQAINVVSDVFAGFCGRPLESETYIDEYHVGRGQQMLYLRRKPLTSVASVTTGMKSDGTGGLALTQGPDYVIHSLEQAALYRYSGWDDGRMLWGGGIMADSLSPNVIRNIKVTYTAGWVTPSQGGTRTLPYDVEGALQNEVGRLYGQRLAQAYKMQRVASEYIVEYNPDDMLPTTKAVLLRRCTEVFF